MVSSLRTMDKLRSNSLFTSYNRGRAKGKEGKGGRRKSERGEREGLKGRQLVLLTRTMAPVKQW